MTAPTREVSRLLWRDALSMGTVGLRTRRVRATLTALGVTIGIAAMVAVVGISSSSRADVLAELDALGTNLLSVTPGQSFLGKDSTLPVTAASMIRRINPVDSAAALTSVADATVRRSDRISPEETGGIAVYATEPAMLTTLNGHVRVGRFLDEATVGAPAVVLGAKTAEQLGITRLDRSPLVWIGSRWYSVIGILDPLALTPDIDRAALIGEAQAVTDFDIDLAPTMIFVRTDTNRVEAVRAVLPATANPEAPNEVQVTRPSDALAARAATDRALTALLVGLGAVALLVGGVGIANVMVISVIERRQEIGTRRALGATKRHVRLQFVFEAVLLAACGGVAGVLVGTGVTVGYAHLRSWTISLPTGALALAVFAALVIGGVAGLYPAARAARLPPADAVRSG